MRNALILPATSGYVHNITYEVSTPKSDQPLDLTIHLHCGRTDVEAEAPILWLPDGESQLIGKDPDTGKD